MALRIDFCHSTPPSHTTTPHSHTFKKMSADHDTVFHAKAPLKEGLQAASIGAGVGLLVSAVQNSIGTHSAGATGVFARTGNTIGIFGKVEKQPSLILTLKVARHGALKLAHFRKQEKLKN